MSSRLLAYVLFSCVATAIFFGSLVFVASVMKLTPPDWILIAFFLTAGNCAIALGLFFYRTFKAEKYDED